ncbi:MAG: hypothetical protein F4Z55_04655 [Boseongicola sp. SB0667_bin_21]|nr:hypothetical protein [Boseongicola sp. SB0667_bin_21]
MTQEDRNHVPRHQGAVAYLEGLWERRARRWSARARAAAPGTGCRTAWFGASMFCARRHHPDAEALQLPVADVAG